MIFRRCIYPQFNMISYIMRFVIRFYEFDFSFFLPLVLWCFICYLFIIFFELESLSKGIIIILSFKRPSNGSHFNVSVIFNQLRIMIQALCVSFWHFIQVVYNWSVSWLYSPKFDVALVNEHGQKVTGQIISFTGQQNNSIARFRLEFNVELCKRNGNGWIKTNKTEMENAKNKFH